MARRETFSDEDIRAALRAAAVELGEPLSHARYASLRRSPSPARIIQRFGSWRAACTAAGVVAGAAPRAYAQRWDRETVVGAVREYLSTGSGTYADYQAWARDGDRPSGPTVRNVLGGWEAAKQAAR